MPRPKLPPFTMDEICAGDKEIIVQGPGDFYLTIDYDDVDHDAVEKAAEKIVRILNEHWRDKPEEH